MADCDVVLVEIPGRPSRRTTGRTPQRKRRPIPRQWRRSIVRGQWWCDTSGPGSVARLSAAEEMVDVHQGFVTKVDDIASAGSWWMMVVVRSDGSTDGGSYDDLT